MEPSVKIAEGGFGEVFASRLEDGTDVVVKREKRSIKHPQLHLEWRVYKMLGARAGDPTATRHWGIPIVYRYDEGDLYRNMTMQRLGKNLEQLRLERPTGRFSLKTVLMLGDQLITHLKFMHSRGILHRDIKPQNMLIGVGKKSHVVFLVDMGLSKCFIFFNTREHIPYETGRPFLGTPRYAPLSMHQGLQSGRCRDLEALGYVLAYLYLGKLPWQHCLPSKKGQSPVKATYAAKVKTMDALFEQLPAEFKEFITYCQDLPFNAKPNYDKLRGIFRTCAARNDICVDPGTGETTYDQVFDWTSRRRPARDRIPTPSDGEVT